MSSLRGALAHNAIFIAIDTKDVPILAECFTSVIEGSVIKKFIFCAVLILAFFEMDKKGSSSP